MYGNPCAANWTEIGPIEKSSVRQTSIEMARETSRTIVATISRALTTHSLLRMRKKKLCMVSALRSTPGHERDDTDQCHSRSVGVSGDRPCPPWAICKL